MPTKGRSPFRIRMPDCISSQGSCYKRYKYKDDNLIVIDEGDGSMRTGLWSFGALLILLCLIISIAEAGDDRPETGYCVKNITRSGLGEVVMHNNAKMDSVAVLADLDIKPLIAIYIRAGDTYNLTGVDDGSYGLYFTMGTGWDAKAGKFRSSRGLYRFNNPLDFKTVDDADGTEYSTFEVSLYEVPMGESNILPDNFQFPDLR
jgi:hypothetical protein